MSQQSQPDHRRRSGAIHVHWTPRLILVLVLLFVALLFALQNLDHVDVSLLFWEVRMRLVWALAVFALIGAILGWLVPRIPWRSRRR